MTQCAAAQQLWARAAGGLTRLSGAARRASDSEPQAVEVQAFRRAGWLRAEPNVLRLRPPSSGASVSVVTHASEQAQTEAAGGSRARVASDRDRRLELSDLGFLA